MIFVKYLFQIPIALTMSMQPYWKDPRIHTLGNNNWFHALIAPTFTRSLDKYVYGGNLREHALNYFIKPLIDEPREILDVGCGSGMSTTALNLVWNESKITGIDTSYEMISCAKFLNSEKNIKYIQDNIHYLKSNITYDLSTVMYMLHETPQCGRIDLLLKLKNMSRLTVIIDIAPNYQPSKAMLWGEPYILEYQSNFKNDIANIYKYVKNYTLIPNHAHIWIASDSVVLE